MVKSMVVLPVKISFQILKTANWALRITFLVKKIGKY
jgi:hypothetical protein